MLTTPRLRSLVSYNPETGIFTRLVSTKNAFAGSETHGSVRPDGYLALSVDGRQHLCHRLAWLYVYGDWPAAHTDHIDGDRANNRIVNLRAASAAENGRNRTRKQKRNSSGVRGVYWFSSRNKWVAQIGVDRKVFNLGYFATIEAAACARRDAEIKFYGNFRGQS